MTTTDFEKAKDLGREPIIDITQDRADKVDSNLKLKAKITSHFRVALKPQDVNAPVFKKLKTGKDGGKENIEIITILDDGEEDNKRKSRQPQQVLPVGESSSLFQPLGSQNSLPPATSSQPQQTFGKTLLDFHKSSQQLQQQQQQHHHHQQPLQKKQPLRLQSQSQQIPQVPQILKLFQKQQQIQEQKQSQSQPQTLLQHKQPIPKPRESLNLPLVQNANKYIPPPGLSPSIIDHDFTLLDDIRCEPHYAWESFQYDREQEVRYQSINYFDDGKLNHDITPHKRAELVDWLVSLLNMFELDHEPLYMAVKLADQYLMRKVVPKDKLELLFITSLFISAKFDERTTPVEISRLLEAVELRFDTRYVGKQIVRLEADILTTLNFDIRYPLSYGFLRRFARCTGSDKKTLNLARYILEGSLLEHDMIDILESKMAAGSLLLAFQMLQNNDNDGAWTETAEFYTGYKQEELTQLSMRLHNMIIRLSRKKKSAIRGKYAHKYFMKVAEIPLISLLSSDLRYYH